MTGVVESVFRQTQSCPAREVMQASALDPILGGWSNVVTSRELSQHIWSLFQSLDQVRPNRARTGLRLHQACRAPSTNARALGGKVAQDQTQLTCANFLYPP